MSTHYLKNPVIKLALIAAAALSVVALHSTFIAQAGGEPNGTIGFLFTVTTTDDHDDSSCDADCTLREAITAANSTVSPDFITFSVTGTINLTSALPNIIDAVDIHGPGANALTVRRNTGGNYRIFNVTTAGTVTFSGLTVSNGATAQNGGGINKSGGTVNVIDCKLSNNVGRRGGAINTSGGTLNVTNTTLNDNAAGDSGGGIANNLSTVNVTNSTLSGNHADEFGAGGGTCGGGGIANGDNFTSQLGILNVTNSTFTGNTTFHGGGICNVANSVANVTNSTFSRNTSFLSSSGGGIHSDSSGPVTIRSSIIALSTGTVGRDVTGLIVSSGFNLIGKSDGSTGFTQPTDQIGTIAAPLDPKLDPTGLQNNGGLTQTISLLSDSPAIDKGTSTGLSGPLTTDQRGPGFPRTFDNPAVANATGGDGTDIGAFELQPAAPTPIAAGVASLINESCVPTNGAIDPGDRVTVNFELVNNGANNTSNLIATLQTSGGVIAPSAPQSYGVIASNSSATRDFSFTAAGSLVSGQMITATLQLQDGASNLGTVNFNFIAGPTPCGGVRLVVSSSLSRANAATVVATLTVQNIGSVTADNVTLTSSKLGAVNGTPLPQSLGNLAPGGSASVTVNFTNSTPGTSSTLTAGGTYTGGTFSSSKRVTIP